ncbi:MAG TPA: YidB family protein [Streptosporangiaceae bacterium]
MDLGKLVNAVSQGETSENGAVAQFLDMAGCQEGLLKLVTQLEHGGLGRKVQSWVGMDENQPATGAELGNLLGPDKVAELSRQTGKSEARVTDELAQHLPRIIDRLTPEGRIPGQAEIEVLAKWVGVR